jgi:hypothetical protein
MSVSSQNKRRLTHRQHKVLTAETSLKPGHAFVWATLRKEKILFVERGIHMEFLGIVFIGATI